MQLQSNASASPGKKERKSQSNANPQMATNSGAMATNMMGSLQQMGPVANQSGASQ
jgi:hypothetical protein